MALAMPATELDAAEQVEPCFSGVGVSILYFVFCEKDRNYHLVHPLGADLQLRFAEVVDHPFGVDAKQGGHLDAVGLVPALN